MRFIESSSGSRAAERGRAKLSVTTLDARPPPFIPIASAIGHLELGSPAALQVKPSLSASRLAPPAFCPGTRLALQLRWRSKHMKDRETRQNRKRRREELIAQATRDRQNPKGTSDPAAAEGVRAKASDIPARGGQPSNPTGTKKLPLPD
jgi:hypothetical protein